SPQDGPVAEPPLPLLVAVLPELPEPPPVPEVLPPEFSNTIESPPQPGAASIAAAAAIETVRRKRCLVISKQRTMESRGSPPLVAPPSQPYGRPLRGAGCDGSTNTSARKYER